MSCSVEARRVDLVNDDQFSLISIYNSAHNTATGILLRHAPRTRLGVSQDKRGMLGIAFESTRRRVDMLLLEEAC